MTFTIHGIKFMLRKRNVVFSSECDLKWVASTNLDMVSIHSSQYFRIIIKLAAEEHIVFFWLSNALTCRGGRCEQVNPIFIDTRLLSSRFSPSYDKIRLLAAQGMKKSGKRCKSQLAIGRKPLTEGGQEVALPSFILFLILCRCSWCCQMWLTRLEWSTLSRTMWGTSSQRWLGRERLL